MNAHAEEVTSVGDIVKLSLSLLVVVASVVAFYYFSDIPLLYRVLALLALLVAAAGLCFATAKGRGLWGFILESKQEFKRIVWPTKDEAVRTTLMVFLMVFVVGLILWLLDMFLFWGVQLLMGQGVK
ncbi:preprotein translocase subunit SecE [Methylomonas sp. EFPC3]|uniref:preprotein translocase subunit SecE n=1 Tax=unclassified Methylomonas TaxID=2608980 RepID=UPI0024168770|nr:preprotein translocase subunit SecE [Methylomonas sp. EFPC3]WFP48648.1 preprotein translocase subunit SecE [Methylomonas sp. EFPC3]